MYFEIRKKRKKRNPNSFGPLGARLEGADSPIDLAAARGKNSPSSFARGPHPATSLLFPPPCFLHRPPVLQELQPEPHARDTCAPTGPSPSSAAPARPKAAAPRCTDVRATPSRPRPSRAQRAAPTTPLHAHDAAQGRHPRPACLTRPRSRLTCARPCPRPDRSHDRRPTRPRPRAQDPSHATRPTPCTATSLPSRNIDANLHRA
jgi:hypothetical protein